MAAMKQGQRLVAQPSNADLIEGIVLAEQIAKPAHGGRFFYCRLILQKYVENSSTMQPFITDFTVIRRIWV
jgi:hypothetical protein